LVFLILNDPSTTVIHTLSLHDALPICSPPRFMMRSTRERRFCAVAALRASASGSSAFPVACRRRRLQADHFCLTHSQAKATCSRSEEHTSELQSRFDLVCRLLLEKKKK